MSPLQYGMPGGPELLAILLVLLVPILLVVVVVRAMGGRGGARSERLNEIERRIGRLEARVDDLDGTAGGHGTGAGDHERDDASGGGETEGGT